MLKIGEKVAIHGMPMTFQVPSKYRAKLQPCENAIGTVIDTDPADDELPYLVRYECEDGETRELWFEAHNIQPTVEINSMPAPEFTLEEIEEGERLL